ncbi:MAG: RluA family pseudouridine synthase [Gammaproteobacteria bacterium]|nr:RluA family pseudouridine synthase [Gammaproteobacteria bacterium]MBT8134215.1 RluA family pseudouridine synthase [Gammaproteobacteria bacterium]NNJ49683.1 RluA family pseudouridine synthase [Gammaproteobacteria bacterium]
MDTNKKGVSQITVSDAQAGQRIDNFLMKHLKGVPKNHIYRLLRSGQVRVNSGRKKAHYKLQPGDTLRIPPVHTSETQIDTVPESVINLLKESVIFENDDLIAINKPSGIAVHKGSGLKFGVIEAFRQIDPEQPLELVHRLDRETSGCLLLAKNRQILAQLHQMLRHEKTVHIEKSYIALLDGCWSSGKATVDIGISKVKRGGEHMMQADDSGDRAISHFDPLQIFDSGITRPCSLMKVTIETGRTHQIRVHAQHSGHAIIGDTKYGDKECNRYFRELGLKRLFLHAQQLYLPLADPILIEAPLSDELDSFLQQLRNQSPRQ